jgi:DNA-binding NtrC family response regulator
MGDNNMETLLVVSADGEIRKRVTEALRIAGIAASAEASGPAAMARVTAPANGANGSNGAGAGHRALLLVDLDLPELDRQRLREALGDSTGVPDSLEVVEKRQIATMLHHTGGNRRRAAQLLGLARSTLLAKIRRYGLDAAIPAGV